MKKWSVYVKQEGEDLVLPIPDEVMEEMKWKSGDTLKWDVQSDGTIRLTKKLTLWETIKSII